MERQGIPKLKNRKRKIVILFICLFIAGFFCYLQNNLLTVSNYIYESEKVSGDLEGYTIVQISDLHNKQFGKHQKRLLKKVNALAPDMIVLTGDLVDSNHTDIEKSLDFVEGAVKIAPVYYVTGNHEYWLEEEDLHFLMERLNRAGVVILDNEAQKIEKGNQHFLLLGLNDKSLCDDTLKEMKVNDGEFNLLLAHEPQCISNYSAKHVDLVFSGHAHGGQFILPFIGAVIAPDQGFLPEYTEGMYTEGRTTMVVSRGLGNSVIPLRLFNYPDIVCVKLEK